MFQEGRGVLFRFAVVRISRTEEMEVLGEAGVGRVIYPAAAAVA
jgi:hypothetical protein